MSTLAFLASAVSPAIAAAAAKAALAEYAKGTEQATAADQPDQSTSAGGKSDMEIDSHDASGEGKAAGGKGDLRAHLEKATATALAAAATKAYVLAQAEERRLQKLVVEAVETQVKKLELKLTHFEELETMLLNERKQIERQRAQLFQERLALRKAAMLSEATPQMMNVLPTTGQASFSLPSEADMVMNSL